jgi:hypothetical protein
LKEYALVRPGCFLGATSVVESAVSVLLQEVPIWPNA